MRTAQRNGQGGQAAAEWVGAVVMVALLLGALALFAARMAAPDRPPIDPVGALTAPVAEAAPALVLGAPALPQALARAAPSAGRGGDLVRWLARTSRASLALGRDMGGAFGAGFARRVRDRVRAVLATSPADIALPGPGVLVPGAAVRDLMAAVSLDPGAVVDYVREIRGLPAREAAVRVSGDAGGLSAEVALEAAEFLLKRLIARRLHRDDPGPPGSPTAGERP